MCGIAGLLKSSGVYIPQNVLKKMTTDIGHRGPDDEGTVFLSSSSSDTNLLCSETDADWTVALGSRRLSILDISPAGHMPMAYKDFLWCVYNGEVYNFIEVRAELQKLGHVFRSSCDTEVILAAYTEWGPDCFSRFRGMWGLIIFDSKRNEVIICRDRLGIKPIYFWQGTGIIAIASELKQFLAIPGFVPRLQMSVATEYLKTGYEMPDTCFFRDVSPVPAGTWLRIPLDTLIPSTPQRYWHPEKVQVSITTVEEASRLFAEKLQESVRIHLRSDVPVGCALSGGLDSSAIAVLVREMQSLHAPALHTFTSTFAGENVDERAYADAVVQQLGAEPHYATPDPFRFLDELDTFLYMHDEPVGSLSMYAGYCIARLTREAGISVTLNGQGGDEILSGYWQSYFLYLRTLASHGHMLPLAQHFTGALLGYGNPLLLQQVPVMLKRYSARARRTTHLRLRSAEGNTPSPILKNILALSEQQQRVEGIRSLFLPRLLKWDDRNSMAFSVEGRYPFLDHELIELCLSFAPSTLYHSGWTKWPLRVGLGHKLPQQISKRRTKFGFEVPQNTWLRGPLRPTLQQWLKEDRPLWEYIAQQDVQRLAYETWQGNGSSEEQGQTLFRLFVFDRWLEIFGVV